jgi:hypothetical protein
MYAFQFFQFSAGPPIMLIQAIIMKTSKSEGSVATAVEFPSSTPQNSRQSNRKKAKVSKIKLSRVSEKENEGSINFTYVSNLPKYPNGESYINSGAGGEWESMVSIQETTTHHE